MRLLPAVRQLRPYAVAWDCPAAAKELELRNKRGWPVHSATLFLRASWGGDRAGRGRLGSPAGDR